MDFVRDTAIPLRVLVTWGSKRGGTEGIAKLIGETLQREGYDVDLLPAAEVLDARVYSAAIVGGALYANRWHRDARRFVHRNLAALRAMPVWLFSSGPLDDSAGRSAIPPTRQVATLIERLGARGHITFGSRLAADAKGLAGSLAKPHAGDWRDPERIRAWATEVARAIPTARPAPAIDHPARSLPRLVAHGVAAWAAHALVLGGLLQLLPRAVATALHAAVVPLVFVAIAIHYFRPRGAPDPLPVALAMIAIVVLLDVAVAGLLGSFAVVTPFTATWLPLALGFLAIWLTGLVMSTWPWPRPEPRREAPLRGG